MSVRKSSRVLRVTALGGGFLFVAHSGCLSNLDDLSSEYGEGGATSGGSAGKAGKGGSAGKGSGGSTAGEGSSAAAGDGQGAASGAGEAGAHAGGSGGEAGAGAASGTGGSAGAGASDAGSGGADGGQAGTSPGVGGEGGAGCDEGYVICPGTAACVDLDMGLPDGDGVTHCGTCGETCSLENASAADCVIRKCVPTCVTGFDDCNPEVADDGCETSITTASNCGACGFVCSSAGATSVECSAGRCEPACLSPFADCNADQTLAVDDGCETKLDRLDACRDSCTGTPTSCSDTEVCNAGVCGAPQGMAVFSVPLTEVGQDQRYADIYDPPANLEGAQMTIRIYAPGATGGQLLIYFTDNSDFSAGGGRTVSLAELSARWTDVTVTATGGADFDPTQIRQVNLEVLSGTSEVPWTNPTIIYVDSIRTTNLAVNHTYDASVAPIVRSGQQAIEGSTLAWADAMP